jgi:hypothetical protein
MGFINLLIGYVAIFFSILLLIILSFAPYTAIQKTPIQPIIINTKTFKVHVADAAMWPEAVNRRMRCSGVRFNLATSAPASCPESNEEEGAEGNGQSRRARHLGKER